MSADEYTATIIFGPNAPAAALGFQGEGVPNVSAAVEVDALEPTVPGTGSIVIAFAHDLPGGWVGRDSNEWAQALMFGTLMSQAEMRFPDVRFMASEQDASAMLMLHWDDVDTEHALRVAKVIEESYADLCE